MITPWSLFPSINKTRLSPLLAIVTAAFLASPAHATSILFVGNSFTYGANNAAQNYNAANITDANGTGYGGVPGIFEALATEGGFSNIHVTIEAVGGETLQYHYANKASIIGGQSWDDVVLQEYSTRPLTSPSGDALGTDIPDFDAAVGDIDALVKQKNPAVKVRLYETWARPDKVMAGYFSSLQAMQNQLHSSYSSAATEFGLAGYAPVGDAFMDAISLGLADDPTTTATEGPITLWNPDYYHASAYGSYLAADIFYAQILGGDPRTLPTGAGSAVAGLGLNPTYAAELQNLAYEVTEPVPEPGAAFMASLGLAGLWFGRRHLPARRQER